MHGPAESTGTRAEQPSTGVIAADDLLRAQALLTISLERDAIMKAANQVEGLPESARARYP